MKQVGQWNIVAEQQTEKRGPEFEQGIVRLVLVIASLSYLYMLGGVEAPLQQNLILIAWVYLLISVGLFIWISRDHRYNFLRQLFGNVGDTTLAVVPLIFLPQMSAPFFFVLIWLPIGNGFRYGHKSLVVSYILSMLALLLVIISNPYWREEIYSIATVLLLLTIMPLYVSVLIRRLEKALQKAETANKTKSVFLANMSHELRTPLNAIIGYSELLYEEAQEQQLESMQADLKKINVAGDHLLAIINDILDISKIEAGRVELERSEFSVSDLTEEIIATAGTLAQKNCNKLQLNNQASGIRINSDRQKLKQVLINVLGNACKFTQDGIVQLSVLDLQQGQNRFVVFEVSDTGIGMNQEQVAKIFEAFTQADPSSTRRYEGTGLGLAISRHFMEMLHGTIEVSSELGKGSCFRIILPVNMN